MPPSEETEIALLKQGFAHISEGFDEMKSDIKEIKEKLDDKYVTKEDFTFWRNVIVACISTTFVLAVTALIEVALKIR